MFAYFLCGVAAAAAPYDPVAELTPLVLDAPANIDGKSQWVVTVPSNGLLSVVAEGADVQGADISSLHATESVSSGQVDAAHVALGWVSAGMWRVDVSGTSGSVTAHFTPLGLLAEDSVMLADLPLSAAVPATFRDAVDLKSDVNGKTRGWVKLAPSRSGFVEVRTMCVGGDPYTTMLVSSDAELRANHGALSGWGGAIDVVDGGSMLSCERVARFPATKGDLFWVYVENKIPSEGAASGLFSTRVLTRLYR